jgi:CxxC-x17-CxxC domain-containing protein
MNKPHRNKPKFSGKKRSNDFSKMSSDSSSKGGFKKFGRKDFSRPNPAMELHEATCAECGKPCEVPFKPNGKKPILCNRCFKKSDASTDRRSTQYNKPYQSDSYKKDFEQLNKKLDQILKALEE